MTRPVVLLTDLPFEPTEEQRRLTAGGWDLRIAPDTDEATLCREAADATAIIVNWANVTRTVLESASQCQLVVRLGIGVDNIDLAYCRERGIMVTNSPDYCVEEVAEHALALMLALGRDVVGYAAATKAGEYEQLGRRTMFRIAGQTLGIVGLGNTGRALAQRAQGIGLSVLATSRSRHGEVDGVSITPLAELLASSDFVSLHLPLNADTRHTVNREFLAAMKPTAFLVNVARGGLVDHAALAAALDAGSIAGAALDVQDPEPPPLEKSPFADPRVVVTPHVAFLSQSSLAQLRDEAITSALDFLAGKRPKHVVVG